MADYTSSSGGVAGTTEIWIATRADLSGVESIKKAFDDLDKYLDSAAQPLDYMEDALLEVDMGFKKASSSGGKFNMALLGLGFFGKMVSKQFGFLNEELKKMYFTGELLNIQLTMIGAAAPVWDMFADAMYVLADAFYALPEPIQALGGVLFPLLSTIAGAVGNLGFFALGLEQVGNVMGAKGTLGKAAVFLSGGLSTLWAIITTGAVAVGGALIPVWVILLALIAVVVALWIAWQTNFANIQQFAEDVWNSIQEGIEGIRRIIEGVMDIIVGIFTGDWKKIKDGVEKILNGLKQFFVNFVGNFVLSVIKFGVRVIDAFRKWLFEDLPRLFGDALDDIWATVVKFFDDLTGGAFSRGVEFVQNLIDGITSLAGKVASAIWDLIPEPFKGWLKAGIDLVTGVADALGKGYQGVVDYSNTPTTVTQPNVTQSTMPIYTNTIMTPTGGMSVAPGNNNNINFAPTINVDANVSNSYDVKNFGKELLEGMSLEYRRLIK